jgi:hypothetical protein
LLWDVTSARDKQGIVAAGEGAKVVWRAYEYVLIRR